MNTSSRFAPLWGALGLAATLLSQTLVASNGDAAKQQVPPKSENIAEAGAGATGACAQAEIPNLRDFGLKVVNLWVSHGDATLIFLPNGEIALVDTGQDFAVKEYVLPFLARHGIESLDYLIVTHYHGDHYSGKIEEDGKVYLGYRWEAKGKRIPVKKFWDNKSFQTGDTFDWGGTKMTILNTAYDELSASDENYRSLAFVIDYNGFRYGIGGDIYAKQQDRILSERPEEVRVHVYRTNHHMHGSVSEEYLRKSDPFLFITSAESAVYEREAYTVNLQRVIDELQFEKRRFVDSLLTLEHGNVLVWANGDKSWGYACKPASAAYPLP